MSGSWKSEERIVAAALDGQRLANNGQRQSDIIAGGWAIEHKKRIAIPSWFTHAWSQAVAGCKHGQRPLLAIAHARGRGHVTERYIVLRLEDFAAMQRTLVTLDGSGELLEALGYGE